MLKYTQRRLPDGRFGIYFADRLLATVGTAQDVRSMLYRLNQRFEPDSSQGQNDIQPTRRRKRRSKAVQSLEISDSI